MNTKKTLLASVLIATISTTPVMAKSIESSYETTTPEQKKENQNIGFGTGMIVGALVAGPIGAIVSSFIGVVTAEHINVSNERDELTVALDSEKNRYQIALEQYQQRLQQAEQSYQQELLSLQQSHDAASQLQAENLLMSLQFSTGSSEIKPHYHDQISSLAHILAQSPQVNVDLSGYTDMQGSDTLNHELSIARVNAVKNALIAQGIAPERINLFAFGEQQPVVANNDKPVSFYDRRVVVKLQSKSNQNPNQQTVSNFN